MSEEEAEALDRMLNTANRMIGLLIQRLGGEVRLSDHELMAAPANGILTTIHDRANHEMILKVKS